MTTPEILVMKECAETSYIFDQHGHEWDELSASSEYPDDTFPCDACDRWVSRGYQRTNHDHAKPNLVCDRCVQRHDRNWIGLQ